MRFTTIIASASVAAVMGLAGVSVAGAANSGSAAPTVTTAAPQTATTTTGATKAGAQKLGAALRRRIRRAAGGIVTKTIGITRPVLRQELKTGKTIATIATEHGVQPQTVVTALENAAKAKIEAAVAAHKITAARGQKLEARVDKLVPKIVDNWHPKHARTSSAPASSGATN